VYIGFCQYQSGISMTTESKRLQSAALYIVKMVPNNVLLVLLSASVALGGLDRGQIPETSTALRSMAKVYTAYGDYVKAQPLAESALSYAKANSASDSEMSGCLVDLAFLYEKQGRLTDAERMCKQGLDLQQGIYYENHPYLAQTLRILSSIYRDSGRYNQAYAAMVRAMDVMRQSHLSDDKDMAPFYVDMGTLLAAQGKYAEAQAYYDKAVELLSKSYGDDNLYTASVLCRVAQLYTLQGRFADAEMLAKKALTVQQRVYGYDNLLLVPAWLTMAQVSQEKGRYSRAEKLLQQALTTIGNGKEQPLLGTVLSSFGRLYTVWGKYDKAEASCRKAVAVLENALGADNDHTATALCNLARLYARQKQYGKAKDLCDRALTIFENVFDENHPSVADARQILAQMRQKLQDSKQLKTQRAAVAIEELVELARPDFRPGYSDTGAS